MRERFANSERHKRIVGRNALSITRVPSECPIAVLYFPFLRVTPDSMRYMAHANTASNEKRKRLSDNFDKIFFTSVHVASKAIRKFKYFCR
jgi:hypothetical protein